MDVKEATELAKQASFRLAASTIQVRNKALSKIITELKQNKENILIANEKDLNEAEKNKLNPSLMKRLEVSEAKIEEMIAGINEVIKLEDPLRKVIMKTELDKGLMLEKVTAPIGVVGVIFESRPDALVQISTLCIKSGNAVILKGGSEAKNTNRVLFEMIKNAIEDDTVFDNGITLLETRHDIKELLKLNNLIDLMIPRGSNELVKFIKNNTKIPVLGHSDGVCHIYADKDANIDVALNLTFDSKCQYPAVCNAIETLLVHERIAEVFLPKLKEKLKDVELRGDEATQEIIHVKKAKEEDWTTEYNDLILSIKIVKDVDEAIEHINNYGSHHTDAIITKNKKTADLFLDGVDSSSVMWNCSTRFADGFRYGFGAEVGISTNKIHARGPVGLEGLTIYKYKIVGDGHIVADYAEGKKKFLHKKVI